MNKNDFISFDLETTARSKHKAQIQEIGACIIDRNTLQIKDRFFSYMKPEDMSTVEEGALKVTKKTMAELETYPDAKIVWETFVSFCQKHFKGSSSNTFGAPIPCGYNIIGYDNPIIDRYAKKWGPWDNTWDNHKLWSPIFKLDVMDHMWFWCESIPEDELKSLKLDTLREYMAFPEESKEKAHNALQDAEDCAKIVIKLLRAGRFLTELKKGEDGQFTRRFNMKGCMKNV